MIFGIFSPCLPCMEITDEVEQPPCCCVSLPEPQQQGLPPYHRCCLPSRRLSGVGGLSYQHTQPAETPALLGCRADAFPGGPGPFPVKTGDLPGVCHSIQLVQLGFSSVEMESPGRAQDLGRIGLASLYRVGWMVNFEYPGLADTDLCLSYLCRVCFQPCKLERF